MRSWIVELVARDPPRAARLFGEDSVTGWLSDPWDAGFLLFVKEMDVLHNIYMAIRRVIRFSMVGEIRLFLKTCGIWWEYMLRNVVSFVSCSK